MTSTILCPFCLRHNKTDANQCAYCGVPLSPESGQLRTTRKIAMDYALPLEKNRCLELPAGMQIGEMALFIMNTPEPVIVQKGQKMTLGRFGEDSPPDLIDLTPFGAIERGVSRQHALIKVSETGCSVVDLGSTNGTWLNQDQLVPGKSYKVESGDGVWLGHMKLTPCLYTGERSREVVFYLGGLNSRQPLTTAFLTTAVVPFLETVTAVQQICDAVKKRPPAEMAIVSLGTADMGRQIAVHCAGAAEAVSLLENRAEDLRNTPSEKKLTGLAAEMAAEISPALSQAARNKVGDQLRPLIQTLAAGPLVLLAPEQDDPEGERP